MTYPRAFDGSNSEPNYGEKSMAATCREHKGEVRRKPADRSVRTGWIGMQPRKRRPARKRFGLPASMGDRTWPSCSHPQPGLNRTTSRGPSLPRLRLQGMHVDHLSRFVQFRPHLGAIRDACRQVLLFELVLAFALCSLEGNLALEFADR